MIRQNVLLSNANKTYPTNLNNDIDLLFPTNLFFKAPQFIELLNMDLNAEINLFGNTNNTFYVIYKNIIHLIYVEFNTAIKTDYQLALAIQDALNNPKDPYNPTISLPYMDNDIIFTVTETSIENIVTNYKIERESFTTSFNITSKDILGNPKICTLDFNHKDSIGPLIGFGNGTYTNDSSYSGTSTQSISAYNYIDILNSSGSTSSGEFAGPYPNYNDVNCKMVLYDSDKNIIPHKDKEHDMTISLNSTSGFIQYENIGEVLDLIEEQLNDYDSYFTPTANFIVSYDTNNNKITIKNTTGAKFGIGFDFNNITRERIMTSTNSSTWLKKTAPVNNDWESVTYGNVASNDIIVAVSSTGDNNRIMASINSINNWISIDSPTDNYWSSITYGIVQTNSIYVAVASSGFSKRVIISSDAITWNYQSAPNNNWTSICSGGNDSNNQILIAVASSGTGNRVMRSIDGIIWNSQISASDNDWTSVCWGGISGDKKFVAVSSSGSNNRVMTSIDGITWTSQVSASANNWTSICWAEEISLFVAVSSSGTNDRVMTSIDGTIWISQVSASNNNWTSVCWAPELRLFVAVSSTGTNNRVMTSPNGINWTSQISASDENWISVIWSSFLLKFIAIPSGSNNKIMTSSDGINWSIQQISIQFNWNCLIATNNYLITSGLTIARSIDLYKWNNIKFTIDNNWSSVTFGNNLFVAVASSGSGNRIMISSDGLNWDIQSSPTYNSISNTDNNWTSVTYGNNLYVAVASSGTGNRVMTSPDGITWTSRTSASDNNWTSVCWSSTLNLYVAVASSGSGNRVMTSSNGINWFSQISAADNDWTSVCWGGASGQEKFVAVSSTGSGNRVMTSTNGINWSIQSTPIDNNWSSVTWTGIGKFVAVANSGISNRIITSSDGITWVTQSSPINIDWNSIVWASGNINAMVSVGSSFGNSSGSLHYILGFEQKSYFDLIEITSTLDPLIYENIFADDFVLVCSNIVNNATDLNVIGIGNANYIKTNNIIFAIPLSQAKHFRPIDSSYYRINISASNFSLGYKNRKFNDNNPNNVNFYLRLLSGRHITCTSQYTLQLSFLF